MNRLHQGTVGILPAGALGVAFFFHLTRGLRAVDGRVCFLERRGSASGRALREGALLRVAAAGRTETVKDPEIWRPDLLACSQAGWLPEIALVCTQPDQLLGVITSYVRLIEQLALSGSIDDAAAQLPALVLCSNGIYFQRVRQFFVERLEEATLLGRLPDLWPERMPRIIGCLLRGVTIQTGQREGSGPEAIYRPGAPGRTRLAGGDEAKRQRCAAVLAELGGLFEVAGHSSPTRVEFDKALVNLTANLLGQLQAIDDHGRLRLLTIREIMATENDQQIRELARHVIDVGLAVRAYGPEEEFEPLYGTVLEMVRQNLDHVPSSLQWIESQLRRGELRPKLTPTESWLIEPLIRYAHAAGLEEAAHYFEQLTRRVEQRLALAVAQASRL
ncbi:MAG: hypothetical protein M3463_01160 [Verrucomicrobiota bacterium]|nr:hypothetical protein [Verrucomicrobiota bacterium]